MQSAGGRSKSFYLPDDLAEYLAAHSSPPDDVLDQLAAETARLGGVAEMQIPAEQGSFLAMLAGLAGARDAVEIGTFTGYSSICLARALPADGRLLCLDVSEQWTSVARRYWKLAGVADKIELRVGPAAQSLAALPEEPRFDLAFVDADKVSYLAYYELLMPRMRTGGLIAVDNVLQYGGVLRADADSPSVAAVKRFNDVLAADERVEVVMLPLADGLTLARKR